MKKKGLLEDDMVMYHDAESGPTHTMPDGTVMPGETHEEYEEMQADEMAMDSDEVMEDNYVDFVVSEALSEKEQEFLNKQLEGNDRLSIIFDKVVDTASEFTGEGPVEGPGTGVSDDIPARLSDGEFVFTAKAVEEIGADKLEAMMMEAEANADGRQQLNMGGQPIVEEEQVDQYGKPLESDIVDDEIRKGMLSANPRLRQR